MKMHIYLQKLTEDVEKEFYKTLSQIKNKDPTIYKKDVEFFKDVPHLDGKSKKKKTKSTPLTLRDYERKIIVEKGGELSDEGKSQLYMLLSKSTVMEYRRLSAINLTKLEQSFVKLGHNNYI